MPQKNAPKAPQPPVREKASGSVREPIPPGESQPGDANEMGGNLGGPVDVFPAPRRKPEQQEE